MQNQAVWFRIHIMQYYSSYIFFTNICPLRGRLRTYKGFFFFLGKKLTLPINHSNNICYTS